MRARARILRCGKCSRHELRGAHRGVDVVDREHEDFGARRAGSLQQFEARRIAVVHLVAEAAHEVDLRDARLQRRERNPAHAQDAADDLADAAEAGDDHAAVLALDAVELALLGLARAAARSRCVCSDISSGLTIIEIVTTITSISASDGSITRWRHCEREQHEAELAACGSANAMPRALSAEWRVTRASTYNSTNFTTTRPATSSAMRSGLLEQQADVGRHADRHEEQAEQQALERLDVGFELVTILAVGEQQPGDECAERHRHSDGVDEQRSAEDDQQGGGRECFADLRLGHDAQDRAQHVAAAEDQHGEHGESLRRRSAASACRVCVVVAEQRQDRQHRHHRDVLEQQDREAGAAVMRVELLSLRQQLQYERRRRQRQREGQ